LNILIIIDKNTELKIVVKYIEKNIAGNNIFIVTNNASVIKRLFKIIDREHKRKIHVLVVKDKESEERALRIYTFTSPDLVIKCTHNEFFTKLLKIAELARIKIRECKESD
jgi:hypothetical protein